MATKPVASAITEDEDLFAFGSILRRFDLITQLDEAPALTVFAPTNAAFTRMLSERSYALAEPTGGVRLVERHVLVGRLSPAELPGTHPTLAGAAVSVASQHGDLVVDGTARVICSGVTTTNAVVYVIDAVLDEG